MIGLSAFVAWSSYITETSLQVPTICCASLVMCLSRGLSFAHVLFRKTGAHFSGTCASFAHVLFRKTGAHFSGTCASAAEDERLAADKARQMLEARRHPIAGERRAIAFEAQHQPMPLDLERCARQHARLRGRNHIGDAERRAQHAGAVER